DTGGVDRARDEKLVSRGNTEGAELTGCKVSPLREWPVLAYEERTTNTSGGAARFAKGRTMAIVRFVVGAVSVSLVAALGGLVACGGSADASLFNASPDAGSSPDPVFDAGTFVPDPGDDGGDIAATCSPVVNTSFKPTWK